MNQVDIVLQLLTQKIEDAIKDLLAYTPVKASDVRPDNLDEKRALLIEAGYDMVLYSDTRSPGSCWVFLHKKTPTGWEPVKGFTIDAELWAGKISVKPAQWPEDWELGFGAGAPTAGTRAILGSRRKPGGMA